MMVIAMRWTAFLLLSVLAGAAEIGGSSVRTIYILPMGHGLDQYVANRLTREHVLEVVADAARADAILTDALGKTLEVELEKLHPTPKPQAQDADTDSDSEDSDTPQKSRTRKPSRLQKPLLRHSLAERARCSWWTRTPARSMVGVRAAG